jgi:hypothetical protein
MRGSWILDGDEDSIDRCYGYAGQPDEVAVPVFTVTSAANGDEVWVPGCTMRA